MSFNLKICQLINMVGVKEPKIQVIKQSEKQDWP